MIYIKYVIENPSYWEKHVRLFDTPSLKNILMEERNNKHIALIDGTSNSFFKSQKGEVAGDFRAQKPDGSEFKLSDAIGKLVLIDAWATWCGPCIAQRPNMLKIAERYKDNQNISILMISVENREENWQEYIARTNPDLLGTELFIKNGTSTDFGKFFSIASIPKYILIDSRGIIIDANLGEPSLALEKLLDEELMRME